MLWWQKIGVSMFAGVMGGIAGTPADITNIRMQADTQLPPHLRRNYRHAFHGLSVIARSTLSGSRTRARGTLGLIFGLSIVCGVCDYV